MTTRITKEKNQYKTIAFLLIVFAAAMLAGLLFMEFVYGYEISPGEIENVECYTFDIRGSLDYPVCLSLSP